MERIKSAKANFEIQGLTGWVVDLLRRWRGEGTAQRKQMQLVETLELGGRRHLMLVTCGDEQFLVGGGIDSVETIVRVKAGTLDKGEICL